MFITLILTVLNEAGSLRGLLDSLAAQARVPDEVIVCDGGSTDDTIELLKAETRFPVRVIQRPGANISEGRNAAIAAASGDVIVVTDGGVRLDPQWLAKIAAPFEDGAVQVVGGAFVLMWRTVFELALGVVTLPETWELADQVRYPPSSRSFAFRKSAWEAVGGYPEWIDYCEDVIFDLRLRARFGPFEFAPDAVVEYRPRKNLAAFFRQYRLYARGDGKANLWPKQHAARYAGCLGGPVILVPGLLLHRWFLWLFGLVFAAGIIAARSCGAYRRLFRRWDDLSLLEKLQAALWVPILRVVGDVAKMFGYPVGWWWRWRHRVEVPDWRKP